MKIILYYGAFFGLLGMTVLGAESKPLTLEEALGLALAMDERIAIQQREVAIATRETGRAWTILSPRVDVSARYERPEEELRRGDQVVLPEESWRATFTARQPVFDGRVLPARRLGVALESAEAHELVHTVRAVLFEVTQNFFEALRAAKQVDVSEQTLALAREEVSRARARFEAGEARRTEVLRAEVDEARAFRNLVAARNDYDLIKAELARSLGWPAHAAFSLHTPDASPGPGRTHVTGLYEMALAQRDDLAAARRRMEAGREQRTVIRREYWPTLDLEYNHRFVDPESFTSRNNFWDVSAVARYELWDGGSRRISRLQQEERIEQARLRVEELERTIEVEVQQAWLAVQTLRENLATLRKEVDLAGENYRTLSEQARVGLATSLDVSTALNALDLAQTELARQEFDLEVAYYRMELVTGVFASTFIDVMQP